ncbi:1,2-phenylacetyl-CoA epoxidase subunit PaaE [Actinopolymorpha alba]|uniref:1,2-phenylacetyl-CoA epoxidase subunit PaaE n=1 Tax=Actinopolymorpha alba TaxID=533267 RepID=UPI00036E261E|nr:1,2-phenylacetyl-CoA epoxidase subunit PaaE [Actinopolymorpha alba]
MNADPPGTRPARHAVFHPLRVERLEKLTDDAVAVTFEVPDELTESYAFLPGQHVTVRTEAAGDDLRRNYSICTPWSDSGSETFRIGVKRVVGGGFSAYALERMRVGDVVEVMTPTGRFSVIPDQRHSRHLCCVAAGSGITPILSIIASVLAVEPHSTITLLYGNRTTRSIMFLEELADLKDRYPGRFHLVHVLSREEPDVELLGGRIDGPKLQLFLDTLLPPVDEWYLCGPMLMVDELRKVLRGQGVPRERLHSELFHVGPSAPLVEGGRQDGAATASAAAAQADQAAACEVTAIMDGRRSTFRLARHGAPVLEGVLAVRGDAPFACRGGVCGTCRAKVIEGAAVMDHCYALEPDEVARGYILTCQAHPSGDRLVIDYDA